MQNRKGPFMPADWYRRMPAFSLIDQEKWILRRWLSAARGDCLLQIGGPADLCVVDETRMKTIHVLDSQEDVVKKKSLCIVSNYSELPIAPDSVDIVLFVHVLEQFHDDASLLAEANQVLKPNGHLIIVSFNRWGLWRLCSLLGKELGFLPAGNFLSAGRLKQHLRQLDFEMTLHQSLYFRPPLKNPKLAERYLFLDTLGQFFCPYFGAAFIVIAHKKVMGASPILVPEWKKILDWSKEQTVVRPTTRSLQ